MSTSQAKTIEELERDLAASRKETRAAKKLYQDLLDRVIGLVPEFITTVAVNNSNRSLVDEVWEASDEKWVDAKDEV